MKITRRQLRHLIKEQLTRLTEDSSSTCVEPADWEAQKEAEGMNPSLMWTPDPPQGKFDIKTSAVWKVPGVADVSEAIMADTVNSYGAFCEAGWTAMEEGAFMIFQHPTCRDDSLGGYWVVGKVKDYGFPGSRRNPDATSPYVELEPGAMVFGGYFVENPRGGGRHSRNIMVDIPDDARPPNLCGGS